MTGTNDTTEVILVGLGNIGFRHLQGLTAIGDRLKLMGVDPMEAGRERALKEWRDKTGKDAAVQSDLAGLPAECHTLILATPARGRLELLDRALSKTRPKFIVLEKVVFQSPGDFQAAETLAAGAGAKLFVNCPRRMWPLYQALKAFGAGTDATTHLRYASRLLGLACNSVHLIDALQFLSGGAPAIELIGAEIGEVFPSKRDGYLECYGTLTYRAQSGARLTISVLPEDGDALSASLEHGGVRYRLDEAGGRLVPDGSPDGAPAVEAGRAPYQSELTGALVQTLLDTGTSPLATLPESAEVHRALFAAITAPFQRAGIDVSRGLPIT